MLIVPWTFQSVSAKVNLPVLRTTSKAGTVGAPTEQSTSPWLPARPHKTRINKDYGQIPGTRSSLHPASATRSFLTSRRSAPEWRPLWYLINPSLQPKGLNSQWRTAHRDEGGQSGTAKGCNKLRETISERRKWAEPKS